MIGSVCISHFFLTAEDGTYSPETAGREAERDPTEVPAADEEEVIEESEEETGEEAGCININEASVDELQEITHSVRNERKKW
ncbi:hypothetical protein [Salsuginibacillus kocurii]|uniref:hypothetical protein n=1 Tax=Salsuginibacillus kocurii TaxID=427078 RepID=UPI0003817BBE|nr:hypothetical protein [Salsuginibacillus kocurii]